MGVDIIKRRIGIRIKDLRQAHGYASQRALAEALQIEPSTVQRWEAGAFLPEGANLQKLARLFRMTPDEVTDYSKPAESPETRSMREQLAQLEARLAAIEGAKSAPAPSASIDGVVAQIEALFDGGKLSLRKRALILALLKSDPSYLEGLDESQSRLARALLTAL